MKVVALGKVCDINPRKPKGLDSNALCSFVPMESVNDSFGVITKLETRRVGDVEKGYTFFADNDVLFAKITPCMENGKGALAKGLTNGIGFGSTEFHVVRACDGILPEWSHYYLRLKSVREDAERKMTGSAGQRRVPTSYLDELPIPFPPLPEQKRLAAILARADRLRRLRRYALDVSGSYLQSVFLEMFGDPETNPKGWKIIELAGIAKVQGGLQLSSKRNALARQEPYLRVANVFRDSLDLSEIKMIGLTDAEFERVKLVHGDILVVEGHGNAQEIGRAAIWDGSIQNCVHQNHLIRVRVKNAEASNVYLSRYLNSLGGRSYFSKVSNVVCYPRTPE